MRHPDFYWYEFRAVGEKRRNLVPAKYIQDEVDSLGSRPENTHISIFRYDDEIKEYRRENDNRTRGYRGKCYADYLPIDIDIEEGDSIAPSVKAARDIVEFLEKEWQLDYYDYACYFTGGRGFHFHIPTKLFGDIPPNEKYPSILYELLIELFKEGDGKIIRKVDDGDSNVFYRSEFIDFAPYSPLHMLRMPGTIHEKTQRWKIPIHEEELMSGDIEEAANRIWEAGAEKRPSYSPQPEDKLSPIGDRVSDRLDNEGLKHRRQSDAVGTVDFQNHMTTDDLVGIGKPGFGQFAMDARKTMQVLSAGLSEGESVAGLGGRHDALCHLVGKMKNKWSLPKDWASALLIHWNNANDDPLPKREFNKVINDIYKRSN
jgi:hypothetical protein